MDPNWASEHLQVIRTLMERSAIYRRALGPILLLAGALGVAGAVGACFWPMESNRAFAAFWLAIGCVGLLGAYWLVRRQAWRDQEAFWSPPTRRVTQALTPAFFAGLVAGAALVIGGNNLVTATWLVACAWVILYGAALHAAGFFMERGMKRFGAAVVGLGCALLLLAVFKPRLQTTEVAHWIMGGCFGVLHLAYGAYLYVSERRTRP